MATNSHTETDFATINGTQIFYTSSNPDHSEKMVMIHAGICDHRMWKAQVEYFAQRFHVVTFDMHSFGQSGIPTAPFAFHRDVINLFDHLNIDSAWVMAASLGGAIAFDVALMHPERVNGLILVAPAIAGYKYTGDPHPLTAQVNQADDDGNLALVNELEIQMWVDGKGRTPDDLDPTLRDLVLEMNMIALQADDAFWELEEEINPPALERLSELAMPVLLLYGDLDVPASLDRAQTIATKIAGIQTAIIKDTAHLPNMEKPELFNQMVDDFLERI